MAISAAEKANRLRLEQAWLAMFCSALSGYRPDEDSFERRLAADEQDERDDLYIDDAMNFAENAADNGLKTFMDAFGAKVGGAYEPPAHRGEADDEEEEEEEEDSEEEEEEPPRRARARARR
jgi:hypothetical protein